MKKYFIIPIVLFTLFSCNSDDIVISDFVDIYAYTQEEKDAEVAWIENYIQENNIPAVSTDSGLFYVIEREGNGLFPEGNDTVVFHYVLTNPKTGEVLDSSNRENNVNGISTRLNQLISGVTEGLLLVNEGSIIKVIIPSFLAYGKRGSSPVIDPETILTFDLELNIVLKN